MQTVNEQMLHALQYIYAVLRDSQMRDKVEAAGMNYSILENAIETATGEKPY